MSAVDRDVALYVAARWRAAVEEQVQRGPLPPEIGATELLALICQESAGDPYAIRPEPGFWRRYGRNVLAAIAASRTRTDDRWARYPELLSTSYGLCQILYPVALERGLVLVYPTQLCDPRTNLEAAARHLTWCRAHAPWRTGNTLRDLLLRYNGGGHPGYAAEVLAWRDCLRRG